MIDSPTHNTRVMIYAMLAYLRIAPSQVIDKDTTEKANFIDWMRFIRNVYNPEFLLSELYTLRIKRIQSMKLAFSVVSLSIT